MPKPLAYDTLLDLARQRLAFMAASPNWTRTARADALLLEREVADELAAFNRGIPRRRLCVTSQAIPARIAA